MFGVTNMLCFIYGINIIFHQGSFFLSGLNRINFALFMGSTSYFGGLFPFSLGTHAASHKFFINWFSHARFPRSSE